MRALEQGDTLAVRLLTKIFNAVQSLSPIVDLTELVLGVALGVLLRAGFQSLLGFWLDLRLEIVL